MLFQRYVHANVKLIISLGPTRHEVHIEDQPGPVHFLNITSKVILGDIRA